MHCLPASLSCFRVFVILYVLLHPPYTRMVTAGTRCRTASMIRPDNALNSWPKMAYSKIWITKTREHEKDKRTERVLHYDDPLFARFPFVLSCFRDPLCITPSTFNSNSTWRNAVPYCFDDPTCQRLEFMAHDGLLEDWIAKTREHEKDKRIVHHDDPLFARFLFVLSCFRDPFVFLHPPYTRTVPSGTRPWGAEFFVRTPVRFGITAC